jgi:hypothetical protein
MENAYVVRARRSTYRDVDRDERGGQPPARITRMLRRDAWDREPSRDAVLSQRGLLRREAANRIQVDSREDTAFVEKAPPCWAARRLSTLKR